MDSRVSGQAGGDGLPPVSLPGGPDSPLQASFTQSPPVLRLAGDIDEGTYQELTEALAWAAAVGEPRIQVDLRGVDYCDVAGLRAILSLARRPGNGQANGHATVEQIVLAHVPGPLRSVLEILGWDATPGVILDEWSC